MACVYVLPDIKEIAEMQNKLKDIPLNTLGNELLVLKTEMQAALVNEKNMQSDEFRHIDTSYKEEFKDSYHKLLGPKEPNFTNIKATEIEKQKISSVINSSEFKNAATYREQIGILCRMLRDEQENSTKIS